MTSEPEGPAPEARAEGLEQKAPAARIVRALRPANETTAPPPPEPANSDVAGEADDARTPGPAPAQEWPLAWLRLVEPEPPTAADEVVAAVIAAEPADADGIAHAFGRLMAAALDSEPDADGADAVNAGDRAFYSVPVDEPPDAQARPADESAAADAGEGAQAEAAAEAAPAAEAEAKAMAEPESPLVTPVYTSRRPSPRRAAAEPAAPPEGQAGEGAAAVAAYLFYLAAFLLIPAVAGVAIAYNARRSAPAWLQSHYLFLIRTFWIGLAAGAVGAALVFSGKLTLGGLVLWLLLIGWLEVRSALGFISLAKLRAFPRPRSWLF